MSITLREFIVQHFDLEELRTLCFDLGVEYDDLRGEGRTARVRELIRLMHRHGQLDELAEAVQKRRPEAFQVAEVDLEQEMIPVQAEPDQPPPRVTWWRWDWLHVGLLGLVLVALGILIVIVGPWGKGAEPATATPPAVVEAHTATPSKTPTPSPTPLTPTATPSLSPTPGLSPTPTVSPADILIAEFDARHASRTVEVARRLEADLRAQLRKFGLENVSVEVVSQPVTNENKAQSLASEAGSKVVIWGWYDDLGIQVRVFLVGEGRAGQEVPGIREMPLELGETSAQLSFVVRDVLPDNITFLSLFVIGHLYYLANEYQAGHDAFDAAMANLPDPDEVFLENEALLHFFHARQLEASGSDDMTAIACEYAQAIKFDPNFAEAYNNLAILAARGLLSEKERSCLGDAGLESGLNHLDLVNTALQLQPDWAVAQYNKLAFYWDDFIKSSMLDDQGSELDDFPSYDEWFKAKLQVVIQRDPSILGANIMLGHIAFKEDDLPAASHYYSTALTLAPSSGSAKVHFNLGQVYLRDGREDEAEAEFDAALAADPETGEAHLALASLAYRRGQGEMALEHLEEIPMGSRFSMLGAAATILKSRVHFDAREVDLAIETLEQHISKAESMYEEQGWAVSIAWKSTPLEHYLLGLLYTLNGDEQTAAQKWPDIGMSGSAAPSRWIDSSVMTWHDIAQRCAPSLRDDVSDWDPVVDPCLPTGLENRISTVYDLFQDRLSYRYYYGVLYTGAACPYVFTYDSVHQTWQWDTTILYNLVGQENQALQRRRLTHFDGRLLIREVEPETSFIDQLYVLVMGDGGKEQVVLPSLSVLQEADGQHLVLTQGEELLLTFDGYRSIPDPTQVWVVARGYYVPLWEHPRD